MSPLTKAFVVVVTVLSVLLVALIVPFVAKTQDFQGQLKDQQASRIVAEQTTRALQNEIAAIQSQDSQRVVALNAEMAGMTSTNNDLMNQLATSRRDASSGQAELKQLKADLARLTASSELSVSLLAANNDELNNSRDELVSTQTKLVEMFDKNNELEAQLQSYDRQVKRLRENAQAMAERMAEVEGLIAQVEARDPAMIAGLTGREGQSSARPIPSSPLAGKIDLVDKRGDQMFVQIDLGKSDGVEQNMEFMVHRGDTYLGTLVVQTVDASKSAGIMEISLDDVAQDDQVFAGGL